MSNVQITRTTGLYPSAVFIQWDVESTETGVHQIDIERSASPEGPWESLATGLKDAYHYLDDKLNQPAELGSTAHEGLNHFTLARNVYYRVTATPPSGADHRFSSLPTSIEPGLDTRTRLLKRKILRDQAVGYRRLNGIPLVVLKRKRWGERCSDCWDPITKEATHEHCAVCFGTSFKGGYWAPVAIRGRREAAAVQTQMTSHGDSDVKFNDFNVLDYPLIEYKDLIVDLTRNDRYQVQRVARTELKSVTVHQKVSASLLGRNSVEYQILADMRMTPALY